MTAELYAGLHPAIQHRYMVTSKTFPLEKILSVVGDYQEIPEDLIKSPSRKKNVVKARMIAIYLAYNCSGLTLKQIGNFFGRDHSTIIYNRDTCSHTMYTDSKFKRTVNYILEILKK